MVETSVLADESDEYVVMRVNGLLDDRKATYEAKRSYTMMSEYGVRDLTARKLTSDEHGDTAIVVVGPVIKV